MAAIAARWSITLGRPVTPAQVALCLIDLKLARLGHDPAHRDAILDVVGYAAVLQEVRMKAMRSTPAATAASAALPDQVKRDGWREQGVLAVAVDDERLTWPERGAGPPARREALRQARGGRPWLSGRATWSRSGSSRRPRFCGSCRPSGSRLLQHLAGDPAQLRRRDRGRGAEPDAPPPPSPAAISRMEEAITWNRFLERDEVG